MRTLIGTRFTKFKELVDTSGDVLTTDDLQYTIKDISDQVLSTGVAIYEDGFHTFTDTAPDNEGLYWITWAGQAPAELLEVVSTRLFSVPEARGYNASLADEAPSKILDLLEQVEDEFERITGRSFITRVGFYRDQSSDGCLQLPSVDVLGLLGSTLNGGIPTVSRTGFVRGLPTGTVRVNYLYGMGAVPAEVKRAGLAYASYLAHQPKNGIPERATSMTLAEGGTYSITTPGRAGSETGLPAVDAVLARYALPTGGAA